MAEPKAPKRFVAQLGMSSSLQSPENHILSLHLHIANTGVTAHYCTLQSGAGEPSVA